MDPITWGLVNESGSSPSGIPIVVGKVVKRTLCDGAAVPVLRFECHSDVEWPSGRLTVTKGNNARLLIRRRAYGAFMRVSGQIANHASR